MMDGVGGSDTGRRRGTANSRGRGRGARGSGARKQMTPATQTAGQAAAKAADASARGEVSWGGAAQAADAAAPPRPRPVWLFGTEKTGSCEGVSTLVHWLHKHSKGTISVSGAITTDGRLFLAPSYGYEGEGPPSCWRNSALEHAQFVGLALCDAAGGAHTGAGSRAIAGPGGGGSNVGTADGVSACASGGGAPPGGQRGAKADLDASNVGSSLGASGNASGAGTNSAIASGAITSAGASGSRVPSRGRARAQPSSRDASAPNVDHGGIEDRVREAWELGLQKVESSECEEGGSGGESSSEGEDGGGAKDAFVDKRVLGLQYSPSATTEGARNQGYLQAALQALPAVDTNDDSSDGV
ncbi:hypothetical protein DUNSADRAFT_7531 [Dunaliella salina]|uniref:Uncharacterized protein n=1 Tax=Dunaliella salina TaxID=3046 RepID=A0ABQ7GL79_DUNSA|nr:hypothetical protein DUNSADRAFT_7531 [Dunaliella salina]|eukprot:KAF5835365.1 hypothetical protein DUNSADRAFT_7531 [Dunaliella salina]